jgi:ribosomal protein S18 acetylase RimI-like enzyme
VSLRYRLLGPRDAGLLDRVAEEVFDEPIRPDRLRAYLADPATLLLVALDGDLVVGQCAAVLHRHPDKPPELYVDELGVSPAWQRRGIGRELMRRILDEGRARGCEEAWLGTEPDNAAANALYAGLRGSPVETFHLYHYDL